MEVFQECSNLFTDGKKIYHSMFTFDGMYIPSLESIPKDCKLILVSEKPPPVNADYEDGLEKAFVTGVDPQKPRVTQHIDQPVHSKGLMSGLKNNMYEFKNGHEYLSHQCKKIEKHLNNKKIEWIDTNNANWSANTPFIYDQHKQADHLLHQAKKDSMFISIKRCKPKLPSIKDLLVPFMNEAIDEIISNEKGDGAANSSVYSFDNKTEKAVHHRIPLNVYPDKKAIMDPNIYFGDHGDETIQKNETLIED